MSHATSPIPMNGDIPTPLTDGAEYHPRSDNYLYVVDSDVARDLEKQLTISRRSCAVLQDELFKAQDANRELLAKLDQRTRDFNEADASRIQRIQELESQLPV